MKVILIFHCFTFSGHGTDQVTGKIVTPDFKGRDMGVSMSDILALLKTVKK